MTVYIADRGTTLLAYDRPIDDESGRKLGHAIRTCVVGSRGQGWYWDIWVGGKQYEARRKPDARDELERLCEELLASRCPVCGPTGCAGHTRVAVGA
ncbi:hypothetical protein Rhe02_54300 [Rhizocola hellebori]|uniref:Uncharacterized protein n=1 Tax=Rhizocola hellebori TaxID=1392758 RepID=A0A8J3VIW6_9ACTN|nr:hypothetical protein [Rhizocola hellebori]GIH07363.1 hypothetical protein Rhe02_54300 [Rhizocola hellebori]